MICGDQMITFPASPIENMRTLKNNPGTYILLIELPKQSNIAVGRTLRVILEAGLYCYVGSALGPGGLAARLKRHASISLRKHWHIDYLMPPAQLVGALIIEDAQRHECDWAAWVDQWADSCIRGFGASDCKCRGHLFYLGASLDKDPLIQQAQGALHTRYLSREALARLALE